MYRYFTDLDFRWAMQGGLKMLSIRVDSIESTRIVRIDWSLVPRFKNEEGSCIVISQILTSGGLCRVGWKCCRSKLIRSNQHESFPLLSIRHAGSRFARRDSVRISRTLTSGELCRVGWTCCRFESIWSNRHKSFSLLMIRHAGCRFVRCDSMRIESNRKVPHMNRLSLGVLDMDGEFPPRRWNRLGEKIQVFARPHILPWTMWPKTNDPGKILGPRN